MSRSLARGAVLLATVSLFLAACGGGAATTAPATPAPATPAPATPEPATPAPATEAPSASAVASCTVTVWGDEITHLSIQPPAEAYTAETGIKIDVKSVPFSDIWTNYETQVPAGTGPDLIIAPHPNMAKWVQSGIAAPLEFADKLGDFVPGAAKAAQVDGKVYMVPLWPENIALIRNTELVPNAVKTMDELIAVTKPLLDSKKIELQMALPQDPNGGNPYLIYPWQTSLGGALFGTNADGTYNYKDFTADSPGGLEFAKQLAVWGKDVMSPDVGFDIALDRFNTGKAAFIVTGPWDLPAIIKSGIKYSIDLLPTTGDQPAAPWIGYFGLVLNPKSTCSLAATDFATRFMATKDAQIMVFKAGAYPPAHSAAFQEVSNDPDVKAWGENGQYGQPLITDPTVDGIVWKDWGTTQVAIMRGQGDPAKLWQDWTDKVRAELKAKGY